MTMLAPVPTRIEDILNWPSQFAIPLYQRDYKWRKEEASDLVEDLKNYKDAPGMNLFLGNLILEPGPEKRTFVVDGQQRLTTILLLLIACRMRARALGLSLLEPRIQEKLTFMNSTTGESSGSRLIASDSIREVFEHIVNTSWDGSFPEKINKKHVSRKTRKIKPIYDYFQKEISGFDAAGLSSFLGALYDSYVARIEVKNEEEALSIFERTNARGMDLEISDLLKNYLFSEKVDAIEKLWTTIVENSDGTLLRMLKYFFVSKQGYTSKSQLYKGLRAYGKRVGAQALTAELETFSQFYQIVKNPSPLAAKAFFETQEFEEVYPFTDRYERIDRSLQGLKEFGVVQFCPVAFAACLCISRNDGKLKSGDAKKLVQLFDVFEKYHFVNNAICERVGNEVEQLYAETCVQYSKSDDFIQTTDRFVNSLKEKLASEDEFVVNFCRLSYAPDQTSLLHYIFDRFNNFGLDPGQCVAIYNADAKLRRRNHNIEHWLPQSAKGQEAKDNIGNLLAIYFKDNSSLQNLSPVEKLEKLKGPLSKNIQNLQYVQKFIERYGPEAVSWDTDAIERRARDMAREAYTRIWKIS